jgi:hypothetical protein
MKTKTSASIIRLAPLALLAIGAMSCGLDRQSAPDLTGPSEFALSVTLSATPDTITQDGESQATITAVVKDPGGAPVRGVTLNFSASSSSSLIRSVSFSESSVVTDGNGVATTRLIAPPPPATVPSNPPVITVIATPLGTNYANAAGRPVDVLLLAPAGTPLSNLNPVAVITADPRVANYNEKIRFDASLTTDEGQACASRCTYIWEFGDNTVAVRGMSAEHTYPLPGAYEVTLTVTDDRGGVSVATVDIRIIGPTAPVASFTVNPVSPTAGSTATFDASATTVGTGATISSYAWNFGDASPTVTSSSATTSYRYVLAGSYTVTLTVTDSLGRQAISTATITVQ